MGILTYHNYPWCSTLDEQANQRVNLHETFMTINIMGSTDTIGFLS